VKLAKVVSVALAGVASVSVAATANAIPMNFEAMVERIFIPLLSHTRLRLPPE
jgi:hypothetical protein